MHRFTTTLGAGLICSLLAFVAGADQGGRYIVKFTQPAAGKAALGAAGGTLIKELGPQNAAAAYIPSRALQGLRRSPHIEYIESDPIRKPLSQTVPFGIEMVQADQVPEPSAGAANRTVCIIDSGYYDQHEDLAANNVSGDGINWYRDGCGHGTHVAGTIAALNNGTGVVGVLPGGTVGLHIVRVFGDNCLWAFASDLIDALNRCEAAGAHVVNMSLGGSFKSRTEERAFRQADNRGLLSVAAAGNGGTGSPHYPASYKSVVSAAAVDENKVVAAFSQKNSQVELAAPGVAVLSTVPWIDLNTLSIGGVTYSGNYIENANRTDGAGKNGPLADGGLCDSTGAWDGKVVLCERGDISFFDKVINVQNSGGSAAVIFNNAPGNFLGTLGSGNSSSIPAISLSQEDGQSALLQAGSSGAVVSQSEEPASGYEAWNGTSMATPHVSGVAALVWSHHDQCTNDEIRDALASTAEDLGEPGRDNSYGFGLVQAAAALAALDVNGCDGTGCSPSESPETSCSDGVDNDCDGLSDGSDPDCDSGGGSCTEGQPGDSCTDNSDCCSNKCKGKPGSRTCK